MRKLIEDYKWEMLGTACSFVVVLLLGWLILLTTGGCVFSPEFGAARPASTNSPSR